jgi:hypothetical protein
MRALKTLEALSRRECSVNPSFSTLSVNFETWQGGNGYFMLAR